MKYVFSVNCTESCMCVSVCVGGFPRSPLCARLMIYEGPLKRISHIFAYEVAIWRSHALKICTRSHCRVMHMSMSP